MAQRMGMASRLGNAMQELGWERKKSRFEERYPEWGYERGTVLERQQRLKVDTYRGIVPSQPNDQREKSR